MIESRLEGYVAFTAFRFVGASLLQIPTGSEKHMRRKDRTSPVHCEVQQFRQVWIWAVVAICAGLMWFASATPLLLHRPLGDRPMPDALLIVFWFVFGIDLPALFLFGRLVAEVRGDGIYGRFVPFHRSFHRIAFSELKRYEVRTYRPIIEYGGWGIRYSCSGKGYNVSGRRGQQLELLNGKRLLIGSQQPEELLRAIQAQVDERHDERA